MDLRDGLCSLPHHHFLVLKDFKHMTLLESLALKNTKTEGGQGGVVVVVVVCVCVRACVHACFCLGPEHVQSTVCVRLPLALPLPRVCSCVLFG